MSKMSMSTTNNNQKDNPKKRYWAFILYPESAPDDWRDILQSKGLQCAVSPLHDKDINPTGEPKKAHYHIILVYSGPTTYNVVKSNITDVLNQPHPQPLEQIKGYYRYFTHMDNPEKYQYCKDDITTISGFSITDFVQLATSEEDELLEHLEDIVIHQNITELFDLTNFLKSNNLIDELKYLRRNTYYISSLIKSQRHIRINATNFITPSVNRLTGEVVATQENNELNEDIGAE